MKEETSIAFYSYNFTPSDEWTGADDNS